jgi:hypothetical protein
MALFGFRTRNPERDRQTDTMRFHGLRRAIRHAVAEIELERSGLRRRYDDAAVDAAFSFENMENEGETDEAAAHVDELTQTLIRFSQRIKFLEKQIAFMQEIDETMTKFENANGLGQLEPGDSRVNTKSPVRTS